MSELETKSPINSMEMAKNLSSTAILITLFGTVISFLTNFLIFDAWGIPFASVVSASDIVTGGAEAVESSFVLILPIGLAIIAARKVAPFFRISLLLRILSLILFVVGALSLFAGIQGDIGFEIPTLIISEELFPFVYLATIAGFIFAVLVNSDQKFGPYLVALAVFMAFLAQLDRTAAKRYGEMIVFEQSSRCTDVEYVVWAGSNSLVTTCSPPPHKRGKPYFIVERGDKTLRVQNEKILKGL